MPLLLAALVVLAAICMFLIGPPAHGSTLRITGSHQINTLLQRSLFWFSCLILGLVVLFPIIWFLAIILA